MCGICGKFSANGVQRSDIQGMMNALIHRGPDDEGIYLKGPVALGSRRLSIIDLPGGRMPISNEEGSVWIVYNGEIYNYRSLRNELQARGHVFKTHTDTEVIVHLYEESGERCVDRLQGMFSFAIWDEREEKLFMARDRIGQKPLYYTRNGQEFLFASEVKAILASGHTKREIDFESVYHYLSMRFIPCPGTMFQGIKKLPPGHYLTFQNNTIRITRYWDLYFNEKKKMSEADFTEGLKEEIKKSVEAHLLSDVAIGAFLSGGLDSSTIVAMMAGSTRTPVHTFAVGVKEQDFNELPYAKIVADYYRTNHVENYVESNLITSLPMMIWHLDEPSDPIAACMFQAAELASRHVKVVLGGDGGDELFGGFDRYLGLGKINMYCHIPSLIREKLLGSFISLTPENFTYKSFTQKLRWIHQISSFTTEAERYAEANFFFRFCHRDKEELLGDNIRRQLSHVNSADVLTEQFNKPNADTLIDKMIYTDLMTRLPEHTLMLTDRMTMAHGLEARSPFLDHHLMEYLSGFPSDLKIRGSHTKYILRQIARDYLPETIVRRKKQGFMFPVAYWFRNELHDFLRQLLPDSHFVQQGIFKKESVLKLITDHKAGKIDNHVRLWMLLNLEIWFRIYMEGNTPGQVTDDMAAYLSKDSTSLIEARA